MKIKITFATSQGLIDGYWFYEKYFEGVGSFFLDSFYSDIDSLVITTGIHPIYFEHYYRLLSIRFPFPIYYKIERQTILVFAVLNCRRDPSWIRKKLKD